MNILFIVPSYKPAYIYGGPIVSVARLAESLVQIGHTVTVYTTTANGPDELDMPLDRPVIMDGVRVQFFRRITKDHTHISPALWKAVWGTVKEYDAVHIHSWWNFLILGVSAICAMKGIKPVLSPRECYASTSSRIKTVQKEAPASRGGQTPAVPHLFARDFGC